MNAIPLADAGHLLPVARRTAAVRAAFAVAIGVAVLAVALIARHPHTRTLVSLPADSSAIVVLDLSASVSADTYSRIGATLSSLARTHGHYGLVVFSDGAYEALPPGTPAAALAPLVRLFTLREQTAPGFAPAFPQNPWQSTFSAGTKISRGLELAHALAVEPGSGRPAVILVSDLEDDPQDLHRVVSIAGTYARDRVPLRIVALDPAPQDAALFKRLAGGGPIAEVGAVAPGPVPGNRTPYPAALVLLALGAAAALAAYALWGPRLEWAR